MDYQTNKDEWWQLVEKNWEQLERLMRLFHPDGGAADRTAMPITAQRAEAVCEGVRQEIRDAGKGDPVARAAALRQQRDPLLSLLFTETWFGLPESAMVRAEPGFGVLCDLCSEAYVLFDDAEG